MISLPVPFIRVLDSSKYHSWLSFHNRGMMRILVNIFQSSINIIKYYTSANGRLSLLRLPMPFSIDFREKCCYCTATSNIDIVSFLVKEWITYCFKCCILIYILVQAYYAAWSSSEPPQPLFQVKSIFFFSGLTAEPTYRPPVRHSNPDAPLEDHALTSWWSPL